MPPLDLLILALASWRLAYLLTKEDLPYGIMRRIRERVTFGGLLLCIYCTSIWASIGCYLLWQTPLAPIVTILAISGGAMMLWRYTGAEHT